MNTSIPQKIVSYEERTRIQVLSSIVRLFTRRVLCFKTTLPAKDCPLCDCTLAGTRGQYRNTNSPKLHLRWISLLTSTAEGIVRRGGEWLCRVTGHFSDRLRVIQPGSTMFRIITLSFFTFFPSCKK